MVYLLLSFLNSRLPLSVFRCSRLRGAMDGPSTDVFTCPYCADQFKREDHLRRHELSHQSPQFRCPQEDCDKAFHRNDVLKRHLLVHRPSVQKGARRRVASRTDSRSPPKNTTEHGEPSNRRHSLPIPPSEAHATLPPTLSASPSFNTPRTFEGAIVANQRHHNRSASASGASSPSNQLVSAHFKPYT